MIVISKKSQERRQRAIERGTYSAASADPPIGRNGTPPASGQKELFCPLEYHGPRPEADQKKLIEPLEFHGPPASGQTPLVDPLIYHNQEPTSVPMAGPISGSQPYFCDDYWEEEGACPCEDPNDVPSFFNKPREQHPKAPAPVDFQAAANARSREAPSYFDKPREQDASKTYACDLSALIVKEPKAANTAAEKQNRAARVAALSPKAMDGGPLPRPAEGEIVRAKLPVFRPPAAPSHDNLINPLAFASEFADGKLPDDLEYADGYVTTVKLPDGRLCQKHIYADPVRNLSPEQRTALELGKKMMKAAPPKQEATPNSDSDAVQFVSDGFGAVIDRPSEGCLYYDTKRGLIKFSNFRVIAVESRLVIGLEDTAEPLFEYVIRIIRGGITKEITLAPNELDNAPRKIQNAVPSCMIIPAGIKANLHLSNFIRQQLSDLPQKTYVKRTGFIQLVGKWIFVHDGAQPPPNTVFDTGKYIPDDRRVTDAQAFANAMSFLDICGKDELIIPLWLLAHLGPMFKLFQAAGRVPRFVMVLAGRSGSLKTSLSLVLFRLFQNQGLVPDASFRDTETAMEIKLGELHGRVGLFDDLRPPVSDLKSKANAEKFESIIRAVGDHTAKSRSNTKLGKAKEFVPSGMALVTAEDVCGSQSSLLRCLVLSIGKGDVDGAKLRHFQVNPDLIPTHMSRFVDWAGKHGDEIVDAIRHGYPSHLYEGAFSELRLVDTATILAACAIIISEYAKSIGAMTEAQASEFTDRCVKAVRNAVLASEAMTKEANPVVMYLNALLSLVDRNEVRLADCNKNYNAEIHDGYLAGKSVWLDADIIFAKVTKYYSRLNIVFPLGERQLATHLADCGIIYSTVGSRENGGTKRMFRHKSSTLSRKPMHTLFLDRARAYLEENGNN